MPSATIVPEVEHKQTTTDKAPPTPQPSRADGDSKRQHLDAKLLGLSPNLRTSYPTQSLNFLRKLKGQNDKQNGLCSEPHPIVRAKLQMQIIIVGAGLGGLTAAIPLALRGHAVTVLEQASVLAEVGYFFTSYHELSSRSKRRETYTLRLTNTPLRAQKKVGAGVQIPPNTTRLLRRWGVFNNLDEFAVQPSCINFRRWENGAVIGHTNLVPSFQESFGAPYVVAHRAHLHVALSTRAAELGVRVRLNSRVIKYNVDGASVILSDGTVIIGDLVVAADGI